ncbi:MAG: LpxA family transferase [Ignavibacteria bacterium]|nr:LpxA family transferase [Ignavibacteria bacterium]
MIILGNFIERFPQMFIDSKNLLPWEITAHLSEILFDKLTQLDSHFSLCDGIAIHNSATIETGAVLKAPIIVNENCFVGAYAYLRSGVYLGKQVSIGPGCEIKTSIICNDSSLAHFNFVGDSIIGNNVNFEAGSIAANHFNERNDKIITVKYNDAEIKTNTEKFGSLIGDNTKIGANAVLSPGTILPKKTIVKRLELIEQNPLTDS